MGWKIAFAPQAIDDLAEVVRYIARENAEAAERIGNTLLDRVEILVQFPKLGPPYPKREGVRTLVSKRYLIFYRLVEREERIEILRYWHAARGSIEL